jgi:DNA repair protein RadC
MATIAALEPDARPRERLSARGAEHLTDGELLAIVLGAGTRGASAVEVAAAVLRGVGGPTGLSRATRAELAAYAGIGAVRATLVLAALELGRRAAAGRPIRGQRLAGASEVWTYFRARLAPLSIEEFWAIGLDVRHRRPRDARCRVAAVAGHVRAGHRARRRRRGRLRSSATVTACK